MNHMNPNIAGYWRRSTRHARFSETGPVEFTICTFKWLKKKWKVQLEWWETYGDKFVVVYCYDSKRKKWSPHGWSHWEELDPEDETVDPWIRDPVVLMYDLLFADGEWDAWLMTN